MAITYKGRYAIDGGSQTEFHSGSARPTAIDITGFSGTNITIGVASFNGAETLGYQERTFALPAPSSTFKAAYAARSTVTINSRAA